jgi:hypothetical protein
LDFRQIKSAISSLFHDNGIWFFHVTLIDTERFTALGKLNFPMVLGSSQLSILPQMPLTTMIGLKVVKIDLLC